MEEQTKNVPDVTMEAQVEQPLINQGANSKPTLNENKVETTYEDVFNRLSKKVKDKEAFETLKKDYEKQFASSIAKSKVLDVEANLLNEYSEIKAEILSEKKLTERINAKMQEFENEAKSYFQKNGQEITQEELDDLIAYKVIDSQEELEIIKQNPILAKRTMEALSIAKSKSQPLPKATNQNVSKEEIRKEIQELDNIRMKSGLSTEQAKKYNALFSQYSSFKQ